MSRPLVVIGIVIVIIGLLWPWLSKLPLGHLPGGYRHQARQFRVLLPHYHHDFA